MLKPGEQRATPGGVVFRKMENGQDVVRISEPAPEEPPDLAFLKQPPEKRVWSPENIDSVIRGGLYPQYRDEIAKQREAGQTVRIRNAQ